MSVLKFEGGYKSKKVVTFGEMMKLLPDLYPSGMKFYIINNSTWWTSVIVNMYSNIGGIGTVISDTNPWEHNGTQTYTEFITDNGYLSKQAMRVDIILSMNRAGSVELANYLARGVLVEFGLASNLSSSSSLINCPTASPLSPYHNDSTLTKSSYVLKTGCGQGDAQISNNVVTWVFKCWIPSITASGIRKLLACRITDV